MKVFKVGGFVRDTLLGKDPKDIDYVVVGSTPQEMIDQGFTQVGADFPVFLHPDTGDEYALARTERKTGKGYIGFETDFSKDITLEEDLIRRDLTINAMAMDDDGNIIDPFNGQQDLKDGILRHTSIAFKEDPVRALRIARFKARYNFNVADETIELIKQMKDEGLFEELQPERIVTEIVKGLSGPNPDIMFRFIREHDICKNLKFTDRNFMATMNHLTMISDLDINARLVVFLFNSDLTKDEMRDLKFPKVVFETVHKFRILNKSFDSDHEKVLENINASGILKLEKTFPQAFNVLFTLTRSVQFTNTLERIVREINAIKFDNDEFKGMTTDEIKESVKSQHIAAIKRILK